MPQSGAVPRRDRQRPEPASWFDEEPFPAPARRSAASPASAGASLPDDLPPAPRRTVTIRGHGAERSLPPRGADRRRPERRHERAGFAPDRVAMWAVLLGVMLILIAATSAHAAVVPHALAGLALNARR